MTAGYKHDLCRIFNKEAHILAKTFPSKMRDALFIADDRPIYISEYVAIHTTPAHLKTLLHIDYDMFMEKPSTAGNMAKKIIDDDILASRFYINLQDAENPDSDRRLDMNGIDYAVSRMYIFDHEVGHYLTDWDYGPHMRECRADAYACLRHVQRYGMDPKFFDYLRFNQAVSAFLGDLNHYTAAVIDKVQALCLEIDITKLSPQKTVSLANDIGTEYALGTDQRHNMLINFSDAFGKHGRGIWPFMSASQKLQIIFSSMKKNDAAYRVGRSIVLWVDKIEDPTLLSSADRALRKSILDYIAQKDAMGVEINMARVVEKEKSENKEILALAFGPKKF